MKLLTDAGQPIPQSLNLLLADARKKEERRINKRASNRRSASTSRARKKALVEEMTRLNAQLRRQALILSLLPDMVLAINADGVITFCSAQAERILQHNSEDLVGAKLSQLLVPSSRDALSGLVDELVATQSKAAANAANAADDDEGDGAENAEGDGAPREDGADGARPGRRGQKKARSSEDGAVVVSEHSEQSFPLSVVNVKNRSKQAAANNEDVSDSSGGETTARAPAEIAENDSNGKDKGRSNDSKGDATASSLTNNSSLSRSTTNSSFGNDAKEAAADDGEASKSERESVSTDRAVKSDHRHSSNSGRKESKKDKEPASSPPSGQAQQRQQQTSSGDDSSASSNRLAKASEALNRNVRWHNEKMMTSDKVGEIVGIGLTDDVTGASVTANNAGARLSSLQHMPSNADTSNSKKAGANTAEEGLPEEVGERIKIKKVTGKTKKSAVGRTSSGLTFDESLEDAQSSSSSDSLLSGVEDKERRGKRDMSSEDSGYRESGESVPSREDSSTASDDDVYGSRPKPLAPTCNVCVIRKDLSTVWCEITSSIRTCKSEDDESGEALSSLTGSGPKTSSSESGSADEQPQQDEEQDNKGSTHELLLCFRPIRNGEEDVGEELRFVLPEKMEIDEDEQEQASADRSSNTATGSGNTEAVSSLTQSADRSNSNSNNSASTEDATNTSGSSDDKNAKAATRGPPKKRPLEVAKVSASSSAGANSASATSSGDGSSKEPAQKKRRSLSPSNAEEPDVAESLIHLNRSPQ